MVGLVHIIFTEYLSDNKSQKECKIGFNYETESSSWKKKKKNARERQSTGQNHKKTNLFNFKDPVIHNRTHKI